NESQRAHALWILQGEFLRNHATHGSTDDVSGVDAGGVEDRSRVGRELSDGVRAGRNVAAACTTIVEGDGAIVGGDECRTSAMPRVGGRAEAYDEQEGFAAALFIQIDR